MKVTEVRFPGLPGHVVINPKVARNFKDSETAVATLECMQFPLMLAFAVTIHKSQGMTVDRIRIALGKGEPNFGVAFVALSHVRRIEDLLIDYRDFTLARLTGIVLPAISAAYDVLTDRLNRESMRLVCDDE
jgi:hypothetical protein